MTTDTIIVSGTRRATAVKHRGIVAARLIEFAAYENQGLPRLDMRLIHGDADGLDRLTRDIAQSLGWEVVPVPAEWEECGQGCGPGRSHRRRRRDGSEYCPLAGPRRNRAMVNRYGPGALGLLGFPAIGSNGRSGTWDCIHYAADQGLHIVVESLEVGDLA